MRDMRARALSLGTGTVRRRKGNRTSGCGRAKRGSEDGVEGVLDMVVEAILDVDEERYMGGAEITWEIPEWETQHAMFVFFLL